jgi:hypothetical protein
MAFVNKLVNPTPWKVKIPYDRGTFLVIEADGEYEFANADMQRDFEPGQPGSEEIRKLIDSNGVFLLNPDLSYDLQALRALQATYKYKKSLRDEMIQRLRDGRIATGRAIDDGTLEEAVESAGYGVKLNIRTGIPGVQGQLDAIQKRIKFLEKAVETDPTRGYVKEQLDPTRTCFVTNPPRQFSSKTGLLMFLEENPTIKAQHDKYLKAQNG